MAYSARKLFPVHLVTLGGEWLPPPGSQLVDEIGTKFERLPYVFRVQHLSASSLNAVRRNRKSKIQLGCHQIRKYSYLSL
jgi:hypothetical protein